jgi:hypothetical protein
MRVVLTIIVGLVVLLMGGTFVLQGLGFMAGTAMSGQFIWAAVGLILLVVGAIILYSGLRTPPAKPARSKH